MLLGLGWRPFSPIHLSPNVFKGLGGTGNPLQHWEIGASIRQLEQSCAVLNILGKHSFSNISLFSNTFEVFP